MVEKSARGGTNHAPRGFGLLGQHPRPRALFPHCRVAENKGDATRHPKKENERS